MLKLIYTDDISSALSQFDAIWNGQEAMRFQG